MSENTEAGVEDEVDRHGLDATEFLIPVGGLVFAVYYLSTIWNLPWAAKMSGLFLAIAVLVLCVMFFARAIPAVSHGRLTTSFGDVFGRGMLLVRRFGVIALTALYVVLLPVLGFTLATFLFLLSAIWLLGVRSKRHLLGVPFGLAAAGYLLFIVALSSDLPEGIVAHVIDAIAGNGG